MPVYICQLDYGQGQYSEPLLATFNKDEANRWKREQNNMSGKPVYRSLPVK